MQRRPCGGSHGTGPAPASGAGGRGPPPPSLVPAGRAKSATAPRDSLPGHTELIRLQVCSLRLHASHMTSAGPPAGSRSRGAAAPSTSRQPAGAAAAPRRLPPRYRLPWNAAVPQAPGGTAAGDAPAARPGAPLLCQVHLLGFPRGLPQPAGR